MWNEPSNPGFFNFYSSYLKWRSCENGNRKHENLTFLYLFLWSGWRLGSKLSLICRWKNSRYLTPADPISGTNQVCLNQFTFFWPLFSQFLCSCMMPNNSRGECQLDVCTLITHTPGDVYLCPPFVRKGWSCRCDWLFPSRIRSAWNMTLHKIVSSHGRNANNLIMSCCHKTNKHHNKDFALVVSQRTYNS